jgi:hypothetical protein
VQIGGQQLLVIVARRRYGSHPCSDPR